MPEGATAAIVNVTMTGATTVGNLRVYPAGEDLPNASTVNFAPGREKANGTVVELSADGELAFYSDSPVSAATSPVQVVIDVVGYVTVGSDLAGSVPTRVVDTRAGDGHVGPIAGALSPRQVYSVGLAGQAGVPADASAVVLNVTAVGPTSIGNLRVFPAADGTSTEVPNASTINYVPGRDIPNMVVVALPANGEVGFYSDQPATGIVHLVVNVVGYVGGGSGPLLDQRLAPQQGAMAAIWRRHGGVTAGSSPGHPTGPRTRAGRRLPPRFALARLLDRME